MTRPRFAAISTFVSISLFLGHAAAQTGPDLLVKPWPKGGQVEIQGEAMVLDNGHTRSSDDFDLAIYQTTGRVRLLNDFRADPRLGWSLTKVRTGGDPNLPSTLVDTSVAFGMGVADWSGWLAGITVGIGYAGAGAFDDANAWYGMADFAIGRELDENTAVGLVLDYNGNRTFMPDVPLPGFIYTKRLDRKLLLGFGFPYSSIEYKATDRLTLSGRFYIPEDFQARIDYALADQIGVFGEYRVREMAFHWDDLGNSHRRLMYRVRQAEVGVRWRPHESIDFIVAGGYAFSQEFNVGWDTRDQTRITAPSDEPYVRLALEWRF